MVVEGPLLGAAIAAAGLLDPNALRGRVLLLGGAGLAVVSFLRSAKAGVEEATRESFSAPGGFNPPSSAPSDLAGAFAETVLTAGFRGFAQTSAGQALGLDAGEPELGGAVEPTRAADESAGPLLPPPKNLIRVSGVIRQPAEGDEFRVAAGFRSYVLDFAIENQSNRTVGGELSATIAEGGERAVVPGPMVELSPGAFREVQIRVPTLTDSFLGIGDAEIVTAQISLDGFLLDRVQFVRKDPFL